MLALTVAGVAAMAGSATGQVAAAGWTQYQGGATHPGAVAVGPGAPYAIDHITTFDDLPGGSSESLGLSAPVVSGETAVMVGPTTVRVVSLGEGGVEWSVPREFGPSVPAAIDEGAQCARCHPIVVYTEGWGAGPGDPTASATPTTSVRPGATSGSSSPSGSPASPTSSPSGTNDLSPSPSTSPQAPVSSDVMARNLIDGSKAWDAPVQLKATSRTGVTLDGGTAFVGDIRGNVYAIDLGTGAIRWSVNVGGFLESPLAASDGTLLISVNGYATDNAKLVALDQTTGTVAWTYDTGHPGYLTSPAAADGRIFLGVTSFGTTGSVPSLVSVQPPALADRGQEAKGIAAWESHLSAPVTFATAPSVAGGQVFVEDTFGDVFAVDRTSGNRNWMFATNTKFAQGGSLVVGEQVLVPTDNGTLIVLDASSGHQVFESADAGGPLRYPAPVGTDRVIFTRGGPKPGLATFITDPSGAALTDIASPTTASYGRIVGNFAIAAAGLVLLSLLVFRPLAKRMGPAFFIEGDEAAEIGTEENA